LLCVVGIGAYLPAKWAAAPESPTGLHSSKQQWEPWSSDALSKYQAQGRPVLVDFTASWCLSCQVNERVALSQPEVKQALQLANVALLKADWTRHDEAITQALAALDRSGVPAYALYVPGQSEPQMLPEVLTPGIVIDAVNKLSSTTSTAAQSSLPK
jgi:Thiol:disulfide interchange protein